MVILSYMKFSVYVYRNKEEEIFWWVILFIVIFVEYFNLFVLVFLGLFSVIFSLNVVFKFTWR